MSISISERHEHIKNYLLAHNHSASVHRLAQELYASEATIRRDLMAMEQQGVIKRTYGGAILLENSSKDIPYLLRNLENDDAKHIIAARAVSCIHNGDTIFIDASSTAYRLIPHLSAFQDLTVVTNSPYTSLALGELKINNLCTGGIFSQKASAYVGKFACDFFKHFNPNVVFFSCRGVSESGFLCGSSLEQANTRESMLSCGGKKIFLCDSSKFGKSFFFNFAHLKTVDRVICELDELPEPYRKFLPSPESP